MYYRCIIYVLYMYYIEYQHLLEASGRIYKLHSQCIKHWRVDAVRMSSAPERQYPQKGWTMGCPYSKGCSRDTSSPLPPRNTGLRNHYVVA